MVHLCSDVMLGPHFVLTVLTVLTLLHGSQGYVLWPTEASTGQLKPWEINPFFQHRWLEKFMKLQLTIPTLKVVSVHQIQ